MAKYNIITNANFNNLWSVNSKSFYVYGDWFGGIISLNDPLLVEGQMITLLLN